MSCFPSLRALGIGLAATFAATSTQAASLVWNGTTGDVWDTVGSGLVYIHSFGWRTGHAWLGAYLAEKRLAGFSPTEMPPCIVVNDHFQEFKIWVEHNRPDALITPLRQVRDWVKNLKRRIPVALLSVSEPEDTGIDIDPVKAARAAFELLLLEMQRSLVQQQGFNLRIHVPGRWIEPTRRSRFPGTPGSGK